MTGSALTPWWFDKNHPWWLKLRRASFHVEELRRMESAWEQRRLYEVESVVFDDGRALDLVLQTAGFDPCWRISFERGD
jgi:hypothetical protein